MGMVEFRPDGDRLSFDGEDVRTLSAADRARFARWVTAYHAVASDDDGDAALLALGREIHDGLDGPERWVERLRARIAAPLTPVLATGAPLDAGAASKDFVP